MVQRSLNIVLFTDQLLCFSVSLFCGTWKDLSRWRAPTELSWVAQVRTWVLTEVVESCSLALASTSLLTSSSGTKRGSGTWVSLLERVLSRNLCGGQAWRGDWTRWLTWMWWLSVKLQTLMSGCDTRCFDTRSDIRTTLLCVQVVETPDSCASLLLELVARDQETCLEVLETELCWWPWLEKTLVELNASKTKLNLTC